MRFIHKAEQGASALVVYLGGRLTAATCGQRRHLNATADGGHPRCDERPQPAATECGRVSVFPAAAVARVLMVCVSINSRVYQNRRVSRVNGTDLPLQMWRVHARTKPLSNGATAVRCAPGADAIIVVRRRVRVRSVRPGAPRSISPVETNLRNKLRRRRK